MLFWYARRDGDELGVESPAISLGRSGTGGERSLPRRAAIQVSFATLTEMFLQVTDGGIARGAVMMQFKQAGVWQSLTSSEVRRRVARACGELLRLGLAAGDRVAILSENSPEWAIADYACMAAGLVVVPIYPTLTPDQTRYILDDSGARACF